MDRFAAFAGAVARHHRDITDAVLFWPLGNKIGFFGWAGGNVQYLDQFATHRGLDLKCHTAGGSIAAMHELRAIDPRARLSMPDPCWSTQRVHENAPIDMNHSALLSLSPVRSVVRRCGALGSPADDCGNRYRGFRGVRVEGICFTLLRTIPAGTTTGFVRTGLCIMTRPGRAHSVKMLAQAVQTRSMR